VASVCLILCTLSLNLSFIFQPGLFYNIGIWTQALVLNMQDLYHISLTSRPFSLDHFSGRVLHFSGSQTSYLFIFISVARISAMWNNTWVVFFFLIINILLGYIHYTGEGFAMTILIRPILYIVYIVPGIYPFRPFPIPLKAIARGFVVLLHKGIWSPSTIYHHLNPLSSHSPSH
jgi:hypothetical protein